MGCHRFQVEKVGENREDGKVLRHLISKAERRKRTAENFHVYALLQSTILRLKLDDHIVKMRTLTYRNQRCTNKNLRLNNNSLKRFQDVPDFSVVSDVKSSNMDKDPLNLDIFFDKLKTS